ncbi:hypothetical protein ACHHYP_03520 [Achlya hypogyna]|uniref:N-acetyltransferase domain-containing protein n=1 Tax=Achlya hypogyna TaxID=1202772 RepID=A0A1V9Z3Q2_ACHHY|nr:hypothetical protein ACHHYP_03520 [Achlya hypogyna]
MSVVFRSVPAADAAVAHALEIAAYPPHKAASLASIERRLNIAGTYFFGAYADAMLIGFVNGTLATSDELTEEALNSHDALGRYLNIHSIVVDAAYRRRGLAKRLLRAYIGRVVDEAHVVRIAMISDPPLVKFYVGCGFRVTRQSPIAHGDEAGLELTFDCARPIPVVQVDAFATKAYEGNPAAIVILTSAQFHRPDADVWMQRVALECNLSETAFVAPRDDGFSLRWFTPTTEVPLCGHATLAAAHVLFEDGHCSTDKSLHFHTKSGILSVQAVPLEHGQQAIRMSLPSLPRHAHDDSWRQLVAPQLAAAVGVAVEDIVAIDHFGPSILCHLQPQAYEAVQADFALLATLPVIVTCQAPIASGYHFFSRFFAVPSGVNEDPVTGSAHCALAPYWHAFLPSRPRSFRARQTSQRGGDLDVHLDESGRVFLTGRAVTTLRGSLVGSF